MRYYPHFLQEQLVINTTALLDKQYRTLSSIYEDPDEHEAQILASIVHHRYLNKSKAKEQALLNKIPDLIDFHELVIEILDQEQGFNRLPLKRQCALEDLMFEVLENKEIRC